MSFCTDACVKCDPNSVCLSDEGGYTCSCKLGYAGNGQSCEDVDECELGTDLCNGNAFCTNNIGLYQCSCLQGYQGDGYDCRELEETIGAGQGFKVVNEHMAISCGKMVIQVILDKAVFMGMMRRTDLHLNDPSCVPLDNGTHFLFETNLTSCGTKMISTDNAFVYTNTIQERPPQSIITRLADVDIPFR
ncbi:PREDICTED: signal peptide, CUB and EGF-like domain-containing protein 2 [Acropora digitifera]|uniref:signal peptide, CUB and EGF-like domain-containing protein 2 n=1 Tax=Acropora digitifera TaxID=70779 RepID=UPI00077A45F1|nr:PREDICTED: signal peptide, CUB and EGF-like domain-containing protein 2 [Acropora digitifera]